MARNSTRVDYRKLDKNDGGHTTWRRKSAAGWIIGGGTISNISKAERKRVYDLIPGPNGCQVCVSPAASTDQLGQMAPDPGTKGCTGRRDKKATYKGVPYINWIDADLYFNSCETDTLIFHGNEIAIVGGLAAAFLGATVKGIGQGLITAVISAVIALGVNRSTRHSDAATRTRSTCGPLHRLHSPGRAVSNRTETAMLAFHRRHPIPFALLCAGAALLLASLVLLLASAPYQELFFWLGLGLVAVGNVLIGVARSREPATPRTADIP